MQHLLLLQVVYTKTEAQHSLLENRYVMVLIVLMAIVLLILAYSRFMSKPKKPPSDTDKKRPKV